MDLIGVLITLVIIVCVFAGIVWLVNWAAPPAPWVWPIRAIIALILIIILLGMVTGQVPYIRLKT